jgi:hypothetical protein
MIYYRENIRPLGRGLAVDLSDRPGAVAKRATPCTFAHPFGDKAEADCRAGGRSAVRDAVSGWFVDRY